MTRDTVRVDVDVDVLDSGFTKWEGQKSIPVDIYGDRVVIKSEGGSHAIWAQSHESTASAGHVFMQNGTICIRNNPK